MCKQMSMYEVRELHLELWKFSQTISIKVMAEKYPHIMSLIRQLYELLLIVEHRNTVQVSCEKAIVGEVYLLQQNIHNVYIKKTLQFITDIR